MQPTSLAWIYLILAGLLEVVWAYGLKLSEGMTKPGVAAVTLVALLASMVLLAMAVRQLPLGTAYAVWTGIGCVGTAILGMLWLGEPASVTRLACIGLIVMGIVGLQLSSS